MGKTKSATGTGGGGAGDDQSPFSEVRQLLEEAEAGLARADTSDPADCPYWRGRIEMAKDVLAVLGGNRTEPEAVEARSGQPRQ